MCGIVGYVGAAGRRPDPARGARPPGVPRLRLGGRRRVGTRSGLKVRKAKGRVADLAADLPGALQGHARHRAHPLGHPRRAHRRERPPARRRRAAHRRRPQRHHRERRRAARQARAPTASSSRSQTDTEVVAHLIAAGVRRRRHRPGAGRPRRRCAASSAPTASPSWTPSTPTASSSPATAARCCWASARRRCSSPPTSPRWSATPARSSTSTTASSPRSPPDGYRTYTIDDRSTAKSPSTIDWDVVGAEIGDHAHFMHQGDRRAAAHDRARVLRGRLDERFDTAHLGGLNLSVREAREIKRVKILGCGSACYAGDLGAQLIEDLARMPADAEAASEFRYRNPVVEPDTLYVAVSQSGETVDTLAAVQELQRKGGRVIGIVNVVGSTIARAGATAASTCTRARRCRWPPPSRSPTRSTAFALLALHLGRMRDLSPTDGKRHRRRACSALPEQIQEILEQRGRDRRRSPRAGRRRPEHAVHRPPAAAGRWRARARRSSRRSPTSTPRPTRRPSSSTGRWR